MSFSISPLNRALRRRYAATAWLSATNEWRAASQVSANSAESLRSLRSAWILKNPLLSHLLYFHNVAHSSTTPQKSPLCFHELTHSCSGPYIVKHRVFNSFRTLWQKGRGWGCQLFNFLKFYFKFSAAVRVSCCSASILPTRGLLR